MKINLIRGLFLAFVSGFLLAIIRDKFDNAFHNTKEVEDELKEPILGKIPYVANFSTLRETKNKIEINRNNDEPENNTVSNESDEAFQDFVFRESLRNLYSSISLLSTENQLKVISITSSIPAEGKTLINILLGITLSEIGQKVLIIDTDLRKPQIHTRLNINNILGVTNVLTDKNLSCIQG